MLGLWVRNPPAARTSLSLVSVVCYEVEVSATGRSLVQRSLTESVSVSECDRGTSLGALEPSGNLYSFIINSDLVD